MLLNMISRLLLLAIQDDAVILGLEPLHGVLLGQPVGEADPPSLAAPVTDVHAGPSHHHVEVHAVDTNAGVVPGNNIRINTLFDHMKQSNFPINILIFKRFHSMAKYWSCYRIRRPAEF